MKGKKTADLSLFLTVTGLLLASLAFVYTASATFSSVKMANSESMLFSHAQKVLMAFGAMLFFTKVDYHTFQKNSKYIMLGAMVLLMAVLVVGTKELGARRWLSLGFLSFQPAEFAKFALVIHISAMCAAKAEIIGDFKKAFIPIMVWCLGTAGLIVLQPNMSTASVLIMITFAIMFMAQVPLKYMISCGVIGFIGGFCYALTATYRLHRILAFLGFENEHTSRVTYQSDQGLIAFGNAGLFGVGIGQAMVGYSEWASVNRGSVIFICPSRMAILSSP
jgi:cell division protein FtsW